jgi:membrane protein DedA with SNARE-associated domain
MLSGWVGDLLLSQIVDRNPLLLIALNPRNRNLILATNELDALPYYLVGFVRLIASDPVNYLLGFWFGDRAIAWTEKRSRTYGPLIRDGEHWFRRLSLPLIFAAPNNIICALAGATGVSLRMFAVLNVAGTVARLVAIRQLGSTLESPISSVVDFIGEYRTPILIVSVIGVAWTVFGEFRGDNSELAALRKLEEEAEAAEAAEKAAADSDPAVRRNEAD